MDFTNKDFCKLGVELAIRKMNLHNDCVGVIFKKDDYFSNDVISSFLKEGYFIVFNEDAINKMPKKSCMLLAFQNARHVFQQLIVDYYDDVIIDSKESITKERIERWSFELDNPKDSFDYLNYIKQDTLIDSLAFGYYMLYDAYNIECVIPKEIKEEVKRRAFEIAICYDDNNSVINHFLS